MVIEMAEFWLMMVDGISTFFNMLTVFKFGELSAFVAAIFCLVLSLIWRFFLSPIFNGHSAGGLSASASDKVKPQEKLKRKIGF